MATTPSFEMRIIYQTAERKPPPKDYSHVDTSKCGACGAELIEGLDPEWDFILCDDCEPYLDLGWKSKAAWSSHCMVEHKPTEFCSSCIARWISPIPDREENAWKEYWEDRIERYTAERRAMEEE